MAEMRSEPLEPEPDSTGVGMVKLIVLPFCMLTQLAASIELNDASALTSYNSRLNALAILRFYRLIRVNYEEQ